MAPSYQPMDAMEILELYFVENRARLLDIASFLDRIDRYEGAQAAREDFRYRALLRAIGQLTGQGVDRTVAIQNIFSDPTTAPLETAVGLKAVGAWNDRGNDESD